MIDTLTKKHRNCGSHKKKGYIVLQLQGFVGISVPCHYRGHLTQKKVQPMYK